MIKPGPDDKVYPVIKLATVVEALAAENIPAQDALAGVRLSKEAISSPVTRISLNQVIECYSNAAKLSRDLHFAYHTGQRFHLSAYGMYGFAISQQHGLPSDDAICGEISSSCDSAY